MLALVRSLHIPLIADEGSQEESLRREEGDRAIDALRRAFAMGFKNRIWLEGDPDLDSIHSRADFQSLVRSLEKTSPGEIPQAKNRSSTRP